MASAGGSGSPPRRIPEDQRRRRGKSPVRHNPYRRPDATPMTTSQQLPAQHPMPPQQQPHLPPGPSANPHPFQGLTQLPDSFHTETLQLLERASQQFAPGTIRWLQANGYSCFPPVHYSHQPSYPNFFELRLADAFNAALHGCPGHKPRRYHKEIFHDLYRIAVSRMTMILNCHPVNPNNWDGSPRPNPGFPVGYPAAPGTNSYPQHHGGSSTVNMSDTHYSQQQQMSYGDYTAMAGPRHPPLQMNYGSYTGCVVPYNVPPQMNYQAQLMSSWSYSPMPDFSYPPPQMSNRMAITQQAPTELYNPVPQQMSNVGDNATAAGAFHPQQQMISGSYISTANPAYQQQMTSYGMINTTAAELEYQLQQLLSANYTEIAQPSNPPLQMNYGSYTGSVVPYNGPPQMNYQGQLVSSWSYSPMPDFSYPPPQMSNRMAITQQAPAELYNPAPQQIMSNVSDNATAAGLFHLQQQMISGSYISTAVPAYQPQMTSYGMINTTAAELEYQLHQLLSANYAETACPSNPPLQMTNGMARQTRQHEDLAKRR